MLRIARGTGHRAEWTKAPPARRISVRALTWRSGHPVVSKPFPFGCLPSWVNRGLPWQGSAPLGAQELAFRVRGPLADPLLAKEGVRVEPAWATPIACLQGFSERPVRRWRVPQHASPCRATSRVPASARQSQNVPVSYPRSIEILPRQATQHAYLQGFSSSPLTDSNRRPPPYHGGALPTELRGRSAILGRLFAAGARSRTQAFEKWGREDSNL